MYDWLGSHWIAEMDLVTLMKNHYRDNWKFQFFQIQLEQQVKKCNK